MQFLTQYGWIISLLGLCLNVAILFFCRNKNSFVSFEKFIAHLLSNKNVYALLSALLSKPSQDSQELLTDLSKLLDYIKGDKK